LAFINITIIEIKNFKNNLNIYYYSEKMATKKDIIIKKFLQYEKDVKEIIDTSIIPSLEDIDVLDLLLYTNLYFNNEQDKRKTIIHLIDMQGIDITQEQFDKAMPMTIDLIEWLLKFQKEN
jgi:hypothetical protein